MNKKIMGILVGILLSLVFIPHTIFAQESDIVINTPVASSSYELFWPLVAGKTAEDSLYFLKLFKEQLRSLLIFGDAQKADYEVLITTKRVLEADALMRKGNEKLTNETLDRALSQILSAKDNLSKAQKSNKNFQSVKINLINQLSNLNIFLPQMVTETQGDTKVKVDKIREIVRELLGRLQ